MSSVRNQTLDVPLSSTTFHTETSNDQMNIKISSPRPSSTGVEMTTHASEHSPVFSLHHETPLTSCVPEPHCHHPSYSHPHDIYPSARQTVLTSSPPCRHIDCQLNTHPAPVVHHCSEAHYCDYHAQLHPDTLCERHFAIEHMPGGFYCPHAVHSHSCLSNYHCSPQYTEKQGSFPQCSPQCCSAHEGPTHPLSHDHVYIKGSSPCLGRHPSSKEKKSKRDECSLERRSRSVERPSERTPGGSSFCDHRSERCVSGGSGEHMGEINRKRTSSVKRVVVKDKDIQTEEWSERTSMKPQSPRDSSRRRDVSSSGGNSPMPPDDPTPSAALLSVPPPPPPPNKTATNNPAQKRRARAIMVDRFSRVFFPSTFGLINAVYWIIFWLYL